MRWLILSLVISLGWWIASCSNHQSESKNQSSATKEREITIEPTESMLGIKSGDLWVVSDRAPRHTCPNPQCGVVGVLFFREKVVGREIRSGWVRITDPYDAACKDGRSKYVDTGNTSCTPENGIVNQQFAEWVESRHLKNQPPPDPAANAEGFERLVGGSDDYRIYKKVFGQAAKKLIESGQCTEKDFKEVGGWMKSTTHRDRPIYFTYCGGMSIGNRIYLNVKTGETFR